MKYFDSWSILVIVTTFLLFSISLFFTGLTHALFLEAGVFLVSVKLIMMAYKGEKNTRRIKTELEEIKVLLKQSSGQS